jgi:hypothetical protein
MATRYNYTGGIVTNGLVLNLDAAKTDSYPGTGTTWRDLSGRGNNGTLTNGPTFSGIGKQASIVFDGVDDFVDCGNISYNYSTTFTTNVWFRLSIINKNNTIIGFGDGQVRPYYYWMITVNNSNFLQFWAYDGTNRSISYNVALSTNTWYNAVITYNSGNCILYLNSTSVATGTVITANRSDPSAYTRLGYITWASGPSNYLSGNIAVSQIYNRALTAQEVTQNFNALRGRYGI